MVDAELMKNLDNAAQSYRNLLAQAGRTAFNVVVIGQYNNGKSTLCNALMNNWANNLFKVADVRETAKIQTERDPARKLTIIDTPGYNSAATSEDDRLAREAWYKANLLVFIHSLRSGELDGFECEMLEKLRTTLPGLEKRLYVACSKKSDLDDESVKTISGKVHGQITARLGRGFKFGIIDSNDYLDGGACGDVELMEYSGIPALNAWIDANRHVPSAADDLVKSAEVHFYNTAEQVRKNLETGYSAQKDKVGKRGDRLRVIWSDGKAPIRLAWNNCHQYRERKTDTCGW